MFVRGRRTSDFPIIKRWNSTISMEFYYISAACNSHHSINLLLCEVLNERNVTLLYQVANELRFFVKARSFVLRLCLQTVASCCLWLFLSGWVHAGTLWYLMSNFGAVSTGILKVCAV